MTSDASSEPTPESERPESSPESDRLRILHMLEQGKITAAEAAELLAALGDREAPRRRERGRWVTEELAPASDRARFIRVRVTDERTGLVRTNVSVPIGMVGFGLGFARRFRGVPGVSMVDEVFDAVRSGRRGTIFDVSNEGGEHVEILID
jgi:SHOCT-like protein